MPGPYFTRNTSPSGPRLVKSPAGGSAGQPGSACLQQELPSPDECRSSHVGMVRLEEADPLQLAAMD